MKSSQMKRTVVVEVANNCMRATSERSAVLCFWCAVVCCAPLCSAQSPGQSSVSLEQAAVGLQGWGKEEGRMVEKGVALGKGKQGTRAWWAFKGRRMTCRIMPQERMTKEVCDR